MSMPPRAPALVLALALGFQIVGFALNQQDMPADDPLFYAEYAHEIARDPVAAFTHPSTYPWNMRIGITVPLAALYHVFGVSRPVTNLPCLLAALAIIVVAFAAAPTPRAKVLAMALAVTCSPLVRHGAMLNADLPCAALLACSILCLTRRDRAAGARWLVAAAAAWFAAFLVKEVAVWIAPVWAYAMIRDVHAAGWRATARRFAPAIGADAVLAAGYLALCAAVWGDPLARLHGIEELTFQHGWTMHAQGGDAWSARLTWGPARMVFGMFRALLIPAVLAIWLVRGRDAIWGVAALTTVGMFWFGSSSASAYEPLPLWPRMVLPALPFLLVIAALAADAALERLGPGPARRALVVAMAGALAIPAGMYFAGQLRRERSETAAFAKLADEVARGEPVVVVCGDRWLPTLVRFSFGFAPPANLTITTAEAAPDLRPPPGARVWAIVNLARGADVPATRRIAALDLPPVFAHGAVRLYAVDAPEPLRAALRGIMW